MAAYGDIKAACQGLATAATGSDPVLLSSARKGLDDSIDRFNENDKLASSLMQSYYSQ
jgi:hypothetical protein